MIVPLVLGVPICAAVPALLFFRNLSLYQDPPEVQSGGAVSVLIPARNEVSGISDAVLSVLRSNGIQLEVVVMDDGSTDGTGAKISALSGVDNRVRLEQAPLLPAGWNGKQHACWALAKTAKFPVLCFMDADVRLESACISRMLQFLQEKSLVSGFPRQETHTLLEWLLLPLIHFVLLGFLPIGKMREQKSSSLAAGCGQFMMVRAADYFACGGHSGIKLTMHDGLQLPRLFRQHGFSTDLADLTSLARCRMYTSASQVWNGLAKNATEGLGDAQRIVPATLFLLLGQVAPFILLALESGLLIHGRGLGLAHGDHPRLSMDLTAKWLITVTALTVVLVWAVRFVAAKRFQQDWRSALLHPFGICLLLAVQWYALVRKALGRPVSWRSRSYSESPKT